VDKLVRAPGVRAKEAGMRWDGRAAPAGSEWLAFSCGIFILAGMNGSATKSYLIMKTNRFFGCIVLALVASIRLHAASVSSEFTYQGRLQNGGSAANGRYDMTFRLFDGLVTGNPAGPSVTNLNLGITNGLFLARLDFGAAPFNGTAYWLEISLRTNGTGGFTLLSPRQPLSATPYALYAPGAGAAATAAVAGGLTANTVTTASLQDASVTAGKIAKAQVVKSVNGLKDDVVLAAGGGVDLTTNGNLLTFSGTAWQLAGNSGTSMGNQVLGTTDHQPLGIVVDNVYAMRFEPPPFGLSPNLVGGYSSVAANVYGATIAGGGETNLPNSLFEVFTAIGGGRGNLVDVGSWDATIGGGYQNTINTNAFSGVIGGGEFNMLDGGSLFATIAGGSGGYIGLDAAAAVIGGGANNWIEEAAQNATIAGGNANHLGWSAWGGSILGGEQNSIEEAPYDATVGGGFVNTNRANYAVVAGGATNEIGAVADGAVIGGGIYNYVGTNAYCSTIAGGNANEVWDVFGGSIGGGDYNTIDDFADYATVGGGFDNWVQPSASRATIPGGTGAAARNYGQMAYASGMTAGYGDAQTSLYVLRQTTTNATRLELFLDGDAERMYLLTNMTWSFQVMIVGTTSTGGSACYEAKGGIKNVGGNVSFIGGGTLSNAVSIATDTALAGLLAPQIAADTTNKALVIKAAGLTGRIIRWVARVQTVEVRFL
jgi:hypothetical protein